MSRRAQRQDVVSIITVCTGNICRSPIAEEILRIRLAGKTQYEVSSAGLRAVVGAPMDVEAARQLTGHGGDPSRLRGTQFASSHAGAADLILTMTRGQRDELLRRYPQAMQRTFTMAEFAALLELERDLTYPPVEAILQAARNRARVRLKSSDDVPDPIDASASVHAAVASQIVDLANRIATELLR